MAEVSQYSEQYSLELSKLRKFWAAYRKTKEITDLKAFRNQCVKISSDIAVLPLYSLQQVITSLSRGASKAIDKELADITLIADNDWLMNQLLRGHAEEHDPFMLELSAETAETAETKTIPNFINQHRNLLTRLGKPSIGIIDDQFSTGQVLTQILNTFAFNAEYFESIDKFMASGTKVDLILLDLTMPDVTQTQVFEFAKSTVDSGTDVMVCSSLFSYETRLEAVKAGCIDYVTKPFNSFSLVEKIARALGTNQQHVFQIVLVDDSETMGVYYKGMLEQLGCEVLFFESAQALFGQLEGLRPDLFLLDVVMPNVSGFEIAKMLRFEQQFDFTPILFISGDESPEARISALESGAEDIISKSSPINFVKEQIFSRLRRGNNIKQHVAKDALTGVLNHGQIASAATQMILRNRRNTDNLSLALIDIDKFKNINDTYGHVIGDKVLFAIGQLLMNSIRETDAVGRWGGEEFVVMFEACDAKCAATKINEIKATLKNMVFKSDDGESFHVSYSAGVVQLHVKDELEDAIIMADKGLYKAKEAGRDRVVTHISKK